MYTLKDCFHQLENVELTIGNKLFSTTFSNVKNATASVKDGKGLSQPYYEINTTGETDIDYAVWCDLPLVRISCAPYSFTLKGEHWVVRSVKLSAFTDDNDTLTEESETHFFRGMLFGEKKGEIFIFEDYETSDAIVIISETPDYITATLTVNDYVATVDNDGNALAVGFCKIGECEKLCRDYQRHIRKYEKLVTMSNTWGDRNGSLRVCRDFVLKEMDTANKLGLDIVQIDDGWQIGDTAWRSKRDENNRRTFEGDYWECNPERFPEELAPVVKYAADIGLKTGMWFAPDSHNCFAHYERDIAVLRKAYTEWGIRFFKLDMYWVNSKEEQAKILRMLEEIHNFGDDVTVQMDVTRHSRLNYLCGGQYGTVFVENRYTGSGNSFPHRILRNLWMLSKYVPASRFQFEIVNPDLNTEMYSSSDPLAPRHYSMDYLFASVMLSNPLFWMEMQFLSDSRISELSEVMSVWKEHRERFAISDVIPIGDKPSGRSFTGFCVSADGKADYLLLFREVTDKENAVIPASVKASNAKVLVSNSECEIEVLDGEIRVGFSNPRSYALIKLS